MKKDPQRRNSRRAAIERIAVTVICVALAMLAFRLIYGGSNGNRRIVGPGVDSGDISYLFTFRLEPGQIGEASTTIHAQDTFRYSWSTDGARLWFRLLDSRGRSFGPDQGDFSTLDATFRAKVADTYRWRWENRTDKTISVTFETANGFKGFKKYRLSCLIDRGGLMPHRATDVASSQPPLAMFD